MPLGIKVAFMPLRRKSFVEGNCFGVASYAGPPNYEWRDASGRVDEAEGMMIGAAEAASVHWGEGRARKLRIERSNSRILTQSCISETQGLEREMKTWSPDF